MPGLAFINYRRDDTSQIAQAPYMQLKESFGAGQLFLDVNSIRAGEEWPDRVKHKLEAATVVLARMMLRLLVKAALMVDNAYREFKARRKNARSGSPV